MPAATEPPAHAGHGGAGAARVLSVHGLSVAFPGGARPVDAVRSVDLAVHAGEVVALVGESGSGKTATALGLLGLLGRTARVRLARCQLAGYDLTRLDRQSLRELHGVRVGMIFQDPLSSLNPVHKVGRQVREAVTLQRGLRGVVAKRAAIELLISVGIPEPAARYDEYPHQLSGGMRQRAMIAIALAGSPPLLIADEPTAALDVTVQAQVLELIARLRAERGMGVLLITHDLGVVAAIADRVLVMYAGRIVESGPVETVLSEPRHRYTAGLLRSLPRLDAGHGTSPVAIDGTPPSLEEEFAGCAFAPRCESADERCATDPPVTSESDGRSFRCWHPATGAAAPGTSAALGTSAAPGTSAAQGASAAPGQPAPDRDDEHGSPPRTAAEHVDAEILQVGELTVEYGGGRRLLGGTPPLRAVDGVDLRLRAGTTLGLVGESGSGKTTLARAIVRLLEPSGGTISLAGRELVGLSERELRPLRRGFQIVFQDPQASLSPRQRVREILAEPLQVHGLHAGAGARARRIGELLDLVGLGPGFAGRRPHELSGGQRQRVGIARALAVEPQLIVLDEAVSSLDVSVRAQILNLLGRLQRELGVSYLLIAHDLAVVRRIAHEVAVMYVGRIVESGSCERVYATPRHPYTAALLSAVPVPDVARERARERILLAGDPADPRDPPAGCPFHTRCWLREQLGRPARCISEVPTLRHVGDGQASACHFAGELDAHLPGGAMHGAGGGECRARGAGEGTRR